MEHHKTQLTLKVLGTTTDAQWEKIISAFIAVSHNVFGLTEVNTFLV